MTKDLAVERGYVGPIGYQSTTSSFHCLYICPKTLRKMCQGFFFYRHRSHASAMIQYGDLILYTLEGEIIIGAIYINLAAIMSMCE